MSGGRNAVNKARTGRDQIKSPRARRAKLCLHQTRRRRKQHVRGHRTDQNRVEIGPPNSPLFERLARRFNCQVGRGNRRVRDVAFADPGSVHDPLIVGLNNTGQIVVRQNARRNITAERADFRF
jgi:hypothetical protein